MAPPLRSLALTKTPRKLTIPKLASEDATPLTGCSCGNLSQVELVAEVGAEVVGGETGLLQRVKRVAMKRMDGSGYS